MKRYLELFLEQLNEEEGEGGEEGEFVHDEPTSKVQNVVSVFDSPKSVMTPSRKKYYVRVISQDTDRPKSKTSKNHLKEIESRHKKFMKELEEREKERIQSSLKTFFAFQHLYTMPKEYKRSVQVLETYIDSF